MKSLIRLTFFFVTLISIATNMSWAQDWNQWRGPNRDGQVDNFSIPSKWPDQLKMVWRVPVGAGLSSPVIQKDRIYLLSRQGDDEIVTCYHVKDGSVLWNQKYDSPFIPNAQATNGRLFPNSKGKGPFATPIICKNNLYTLGVDRIISCYNTKNGKLKWRHQYLKQARPEKLKYECQPCGCSEDGKDFDQPGLCSACKMELGVKDVETSANLTGQNYYGAASSPIIVGDLLIIHVGNSQKGAMIAYDTNSGKERWFWESPAMSSSSPVLVNLLGEDQLVTMTRFNVVGISVKDGDLLWSHPIESNAQIVTPIVYKDLVIFSAYRSPTNAIKIKRNGQDWSVIKAWENPNISLYTSTPVLVDNRLYGLSYSKRGQFFAMDVETGETLWTSEGRIALGAAILDVGNVLVSLTNDSQLRIIDKNSNSFNLIKQYSVAESPTWAHPILWSKNILIKDESNMTMYTLN